MNKELLKPVLIVTNDLTKWNNSTSIYSYVCILHISGLWKHFQVKDAFNNCAVIVNWIADGGRYDMPVLRDTFWWSFVTQPINDKTCLLWTLLPSSHKITYHSLPSLWCLDITRLFPLFLTGRKIFPAINHLLINSKSSLFRMLYANSNLILFLSCTWSSSRQVTLWEKEVPH